jgi:signal transduction histidine kinase
VKPKLIVIFLVLVLAPLAAVGWLGVRMASSEREMVRVRFEELLASKLADVDGTIAKLIDQRERELGRLTELESIDAASLREITRGERLVRQIFVIDAKGKLVHPPSDQPRNEAEKSFLERTGHVWESGESFFHPTDRPPRPADAVVDGGADGGVDGGPDGGIAISDDDDHGWYVWYWGSGINLIYWRRDRQGRVVGAELDRMTLLADIVGELPSTDPLAIEAAGGRVQLVDANGDPVYGWGPHEPGAGEEPRISRSLRAPLGSWRLKYFPAPGELGDEFGGSVLLGTVISLGAMALVLLGLAAYFFRETGRDAREARKRVTFVNQVSHELKTPLTNIRMYAELLEDQVDDEDEHQRRYLDVIVSESQRLSRLIGNVLSFARKQRRGLLVRPAPGYADSVIEAVVDQFRPGLEESGFEIELDLDASVKARIDADAVGQILGNLLSNVEKYAAAGKWVAITSRQRAARVEITVADRGPGVPRASQKRVFQPFFRLSSKLAEGVSGTGIGLSIARDLARLHGGDLILEPADRGAVFKLEIRAPLAEEGEAR